MIATKLKTVFSFFVCCSYITEDWQKQIYQNNPAKKMSIQLLRTPTVKDTFFNISHITHQTSCIQEYQNNNTV